MQTQKKYRKIKTVLVSGASGIVGYGCLKSLKKSGLPLKTIGTSMYDDTIANVFCDIFEKIVPTKDEKYMDWLLHIINKHKVDLLIPGIEADMYMWNRYRNTIEQTGAKLVLNNESLIDLCNDKWTFYEKFYQHFPQHAIPTFIHGSYEDLVLHCGTNFLMKPRIGYGSKNIVYISDKKTFSQYEAELGKILMVQPVVGTADEEYTISAFFNRQSELCAYNTLKRTLSSGGFTEKAIVVQISNIHTLLQDIASVFKPIGATNFQFRKDEEGNLKLLEINPRISSSTSIRTVFNYNECEMSVNFYLNDVIPKQPQICFGKVIRYVEDYMVELNENKENITWRAK